MESPDTGELVATSAGDVGDELSFRTGDSMMNATVVRLFEQEEGEVVTLVVGADVLL